LRLQGIAGLRRLARFPIQRSGIAQSCEAGTRARPRAAAALGSATLRPLLLIGAGGFARETIELVRAANRVAPTWELLGVLDDDPAKHGSSVLGVEIIGPSEAAHDHPNALVTACVASPGDPLRRLRLVYRLELGPERYATLLHPSAVIPDSATIGPGSVLHAGAILTADVSIGAHVAIMPAVVLTHDDIVEDGVSFGAGVRVAGNVTIERGAYVGAGALLREQLVIGAGAVVGMGAVVTRPVPPGEVWIGAPARRLR
jgi:sugar O-acyltransferase (sialic acid O-acetyltransferase NeuD family)